MDEVFHGGVHVLQLAQPLHSQTNRDRISNSCASLLLANGVPLKHIQEWLGHSDFSTTANIYAHLDYSPKLTSADAMLSGKRWQETA